MILINESWEEIRDLQDISKVIRENYNSDLADELDKLIPKHTDEEYYELECKLDEQDSEIISLEDELSYKGGEIHKKDEEIEKLEERIRELKGEM